MTTDVRATVARLLLWYPPAWRARYGEEFAELLADGLAERPRDRRRTVDVARSDLRARLADAGLTGHPLDRAAAARASLAIAGLQWHAVRDVRRGDLVTASDCPAMGRSRRPRDNARLGPHVARLADVLRGDRAWPRRAGQGRLGHLRQAPGQAACGWRPGLTTRSALVSRRWPGRCRPVRLSTFHPDATPARFSLSRSRRRWGSSGDT